MIKSGYNGGYNKNVSVFEFVELYKRTYFFGSYFGTLVTIKSEDGHYFYKLNRNLVKIGTICLLIFSVSCSSVPQCATYNNSTRAKKAPTNHNYKKVINQTYYQ